MHILIIGAAGMIGRKLTSALLKSGQVGGKLDLRDRRRETGKVIYAPHVEGGVVRGVNSN